MEPSDKKLIYQIGFFIVGFGIVFSVISYGLGWFSEAAVVAKEEFGAKASLKKYEWFKDAAATLDEKKHTIEVYQSGITQMEVEYADTPKIEWPQQDKQFYYQRSTEISGLKANYNDIVKEYNAQSSKFNWNIYNTSDLPRTYDAYLDN